MVDISTGVAIGALVDTDVGLAITAGLEMTGGTV